MDAEDLTLEEKCENLMNVVVESRKRFGKMCVDYVQKTSLMENKLLNLQLETISSSFKPKNHFPAIEVDAMCKDADDFASEIAEKQRRIENLKNKLKNTQNVVMQLRGDSVKKKLKGPLTTEAKFANVKSVL